jgi:S1-C subfamily serine protease
MIANWPTKWFLAVSAAAILCGCQSRLNPSDQLRHASYVGQQELFTGNKDAVRRQTYIIFSGRPEFEVTLDPQTGSVHWSGGAKGFSSGLAASVAGDGYLVTTAHALNETNYAFGWINDRMDVRPARVVFKRPPNTRADVALIKVDGDLGRPAVAGKLPEAGDHVFALVCNRHGTQLEIAFAGGTVTGINRDPLRGPIDLIETDVPLRHGDSGGPLLSSAGQLVGINSGVSFTWLRYWSDSLYPDNGFIQHLVEEDRIRASTRTSH